MSALAQPVIAIVQQPEFDLDATIRGVLATSTSADPRDIAIDVAARIPDEALLDVLALLLPTRVRVIIHADRRRDRHNAYRRQSAAARSTVRAALASAPAPSPEPMAVSPGETSQDIVGSGRWRDTADITRDPKRWRVSVDGEWKILGQCTEGEIKVAILAYRKMAAGYDAMADRYVDLRDTMIAEGARVVADLPDDVVRMILQ